MALVLTAGGTNLTAAIRKGSLKITRTLGGRAGRCDVTLVSNATVIDIAAIGVDNTLTVIDGATTYFDGLTQSARARDLNPTTYEVSFTALDAAAVPAEAQAPFSLADGRTAEDVYTSMMSGQTLHWWRLGEASGTTAEDVNGTVDGTYVNTPTLGAAGAMTTGDTAVTFDGSTEYVTVGASNIRGLADFSIAAWAKSSSGNAVQIIYAERVTLNDALIRFYLDANGRPTFQYRDNAGTLDTIVPASGDWTDGAWHHFAVTKSGTDVAIYVDGVSVRTATLTATDTLTGAMTANIGRDPHLANGHFPGSLDEVMLLDWAPDARELGWFYSSRNIATFVSLETETTSNGVDPIFNITVSTLTAGLAPGQYLTVHSVNQNSVLALTSWLIHEVSVVWLNPTTPVWTAIAGDDPIHLPASFGP